jgi:hypothetical protein
MGRLATVVLVGAVVLLGVAAVVDALRGGGTAAPAPAAATTTEQEDFPRVLRAAGLSGTLLYTNPDDCELRAFALPTLQAADADDWDSCGFAISGSGPPAPEGTVFPPDGGERQAAEVNGGVELIWPSRARGVRFENARAPAFRADGTLTIVEQGGLVALEPCGAGAAHRAPEWRGYCRRILATEDEITEGLDPSRLRPAPERVSLEKIVWLEDGTALAVARAVETDVLVHVQLTGGESPIVNARFQTGRIYELALSPTGEYVAVLSGTGRIAVLDPFGRLVASPGLKVRAMTWSPDGSWLAVLSGPGLVFVRPESPVTQIGTILLAARDVGWR